MMDRPRQWYRQTRAMKWFCPGSFVLCAMVCAAVYVVLYLLGWRESTSVLCGTLPEDRTAQTIQAFQATMYVIFYMGTAVVAPILVIAAIVFQAIVRLWKGQGNAAIDASVTVHEVDLELDGNCRGNANNVE